MKQFWYTIKKVQGTDSYEFLLANKKCVVNADVFRIILDICPRVKCVDFPDVPDDDTALAFLIELGYNGPLYKYTNMFMDHMHQPWKTLAAIINKCLSGKTASNDKLKNSRIDILLKFVRIGKDYQEYGLRIPDTMLTEEIKRSDSYQMFIKYATGLIPPKKSIGKGSQGKTAVDTSIKEVDVSEESKPEPAKKRTTSKRRVKKKVTISTEYNIITEDPDIALELEEQEADDTMKALKESRKTSRRQPSTGGSNKGTRSKPGVPDESTVVSATSSEGTGAKPGVPDEENVTTEEKVILEWGGEHDSEYSNDDNDVKKNDKDGDADNEGDDHISDTQDADDEDVELNLMRMISISNEEVADAAKADAEKTSEVKEDAKKTKLPPISSSLSVSSAPATTLPPSSISTTPRVPQQTTTPIPTPPIIVDAPTITTVILESDALSAIQLRVSTLENDVSKLEKIDLSTKALAALKTHVPSVVNNYLGSKVEDVFQKEL
nr:hypothetical protein [Tanacetum cinerariifolium]